MLFSLVCVKQNESDETSVLLNILYFQKGEMNLRIEGSVTGMESERSFNAVSYSARSFKASRTGGSGIQGSESYGGSSFLNTLLGKYEEKAESDEEVKEGEDAGDVNSAFNILSMKTGRRNDMIVKSEDQIYVEDYTRKMSVLYIFSIMFEDFRDRIQELMSGIRSDYTAMQSGKWAGSGMTVTDPAQAMRLKTVHMEYVQSDYYEESESMSFTAKGKAVCKDGREIEYDINVGMSRRFQDYAEKNLGIFFDACIDPLVINLDTSVAELSDQKFYFDLDADGTKELISMPSSKSGFIALDKNGDGIINDGSELFGPASGNGFEDLAAYDSDHDGWIDEDDDIFDKLKVWIREPDGTDKLLSFKEAGVGAINLAHAASEFSMKDDFNRTRAIVRSSGMFLYEDGRAGTVQQIDMVS